MAQPYVGEIRMFAGNFAPSGWLFCDGALLPVSEYETLFNLIGTTYGGDGQETFALPDMRGRLPVHPGTRTGDGVTIQQAETGGVEQVTLTVGQMPSHGHSLRGTSDAASPAYTAANGALAKTAGANVYALAPAGLNSMKANRVLAVGGSQPHSNLAPYLCINYIISLFGIFPSQT